MFIFGFLVLADSTISLVIWFHRENSLIKYFNVSLAVSYYFLNDLSLRLFRDKS